MPEALQPERDQAWAGAYNDLLHTFMDAERADGSVVSAMELELLLGKYLEDVCGYTGQDSRDSIPRALKLAQLTVKGRDCAPGDKRFPDYGVTADCLILAAVAGATWQSSKLSDEQKGHLLDSVREFFLTTDLKYLKDATQPDPKRIGQSAFVAMADTMNLSLLRLDEQSQLPENNQYAKATKAVLRKSGFLL